MIRRITVWRIANVCCYSPNIVHDSDGIQKHVLIDSLQHVARLSLRVPDRYQESGVNVSATEMAGRQNLARQFEVTQNAWEVVRQALSSATIKGEVFCQSPRVKSGKSRALPRSLFDASLSGVTADQAAAS